MAYTPVGPGDFFDDKYGMDATRLQRILGKALGSQMIMSMSIFNIT